MASNKSKLVIHTARQQTDQADTSQKPSVHVIRKNKATFQDRLLRNSCLACALLLGILAVGNIQQPWAKNVSASIERALTMEIDLDKSLGQLTFVQKLMPESALVFFNLNGEHELMRPVQSDPVHPFSKAQPWLMFQAETGAAVCASADGTVSAISPMSAGGYGVLIDHGNGIETVTACLSEVEIQVGAQIIRGGVIGKTDGNVYFELREGGNSADPTERMGL